MLCEGFDTDRNASGTYDFTRLPVGMDPNDPLRAIGDPNDDVLGYTQGTGASPSGTGAVTCMDDVGRGSGTCFPVAEENDWHLHSPTEGPGDGYDPTPGIGAPDGGKAHGGTRSMHMGRHLDATTTLSDTLRFRQVSAFVLDSQGDPNIPGVVIGPGTTLDFWHMISVPDDENFASGFGFEDSFGGGQLQISLLGANGQFERWRRLTANLNGYDSIDQGYTSVCGFDPGDDERFPNDETMCESPVWSDLGDIFGTDATCQTDTDGNDPIHKDCGAYSGCAPGPGCTENGTIGTGVWARSAFDLSPFAGRVARLRWIGMVEGGWSFGTSRSALEPAPGSFAYQYFDGDDGWWIDDIRLTDLRVLPAIIAPDPGTGLSQCVPGPDPDACGVVNLVVAGTVAYGGRALLGLDTPTQPVTLDTRMSTAADDPATTGVTEGACDNGVLQYQVEACLDTGCAATRIVTPYSPSGLTTVSPAATTLYRVSARCSSDPACTAQQDVLVKVYTGDGSDLVGLTVTGGPAATIAWPASPQPPGVDGYDVYRATVGAAGTDVFPGNVFAGACFAPDVAQAALGLDASAPDNDIPAVGEVFMYQVSHSTKTAGTVSPLGLRPSSSNRAGQLVLASEPCP